MSLSKVEDIVLEEIERLVAVRHLALVLRLKAYNHNVKDPTWAVKFARLNRDKDKIVEELKNAPFYKDFMEIVKEKAEIHYEYLSLMHKNNSLYDSHSGFSERASKKVERDIAQVFENGSNLKELIKYTYEFGDHPERVRFFHKNKFYRDYQSHIYDFGQTWNKNLTLENFEDLANETGYTQNYERNVRVWDKFNEWARTQLTFENEYGLEMQKIIPTVISKYLNVDKPPLVNQMVFAEKVESLIEDTPYPKLVQSLEENHPIKNWIFTVMSSKKFSSEHKLSNEKIKLLFNQLSDNEKKLIVKMQFDIMDLDVNSENDFYYSENWDEIKKLNRKIDIYAEPKMGIYPIIKDIFLTLLDEENVYESIHNDKILNQCSYSIKEMFQTDFEKKINFELALSHEKALENEKDIFEMGVGKSFVFNFQIFEDLMNKGSNYNRYNYTLNVNTGLFSLSVGNTEDAQRVGFFSIRDDNFTHENLKKLLMFTSEQMYELLKEREENRNRSFNENLSDVEEEFIEIMKSGVREQQLENRMEEINHQKKLINTTRKKI